MAEWSTTPKSQIQANNTVKRLVLRFESHSGHSVHAIFGSIFQAVLELYFKVPARSSAVVRSIRFGKVMLGIRTNM